MNKYLSFSLLTRELQTNTNKYKTWLMESKIRLNKAILYKNKYNLSPLCAAVFCQDLELVMWLLKSGCNKNGQLENTQSYYTPLTSIYLLNINYYDSHGKLDKQQLFTIKQKLFDLLVLQGVDIHAGGLNGKNLLALECMKPTILIDPKWIEYLLIKGIDPNKFNFISSSQMTLQLNKTALTKYKYSCIKNISLTWYFQPILLIFWSMIHSIMYIQGDYSIFDCLDNAKIKIKWYRRKIKHITYIVLYYLILYGANLKQVQSDERTLQQTIKWVNTHQSFKKYDFNFHKEWKKLTRSCKSILKRYTKSDATRLNQFTLFYKLKTKQLDSKSKRLRIVKSILNAKKRIYLMEKRKFVNSKFINSDEIVSQFSPREIVIFKDNKLVWAFHISEIPNLLQTKINPYTREQIPFNIRKQWYEYLDDNLIPLNYPPLSINDLQYITFEEPMLSQRSQLITKTIKRIKFDFSNIKDTEVAAIFQFFKYEPNINQLISRSIYKVRRQKNNIILRIFKEKKNIITTEVQSNVKIQLHGFGIYMNSFKIDLMIEHMSRLINNTSLGSYVNLKSWLDDWTFVIIFKLLTILYNFQQSIFNTENWEFILSIWEKRKCTRRSLIKKYLIEILISIMYNGFINNTLDITLFIGCLSQLHKEYLFIKKIQLLIWKLYKNKILTACDDIENSDNYFFGKIKIDYNELFLAIINLIKFDTYVKALFSINLMNLDITLHKSPGFAYFKTTLCSDMLILSNLKWSIMNDEEKAVFIKKGKNIQISTMQNINKTWASLQDLLYLFNNEEFHDSFLIF